MQQHKTEIKFISFDELNAIVSLDNMIVIVDENFTNNCHAFLHVDAEKLIVLPANANYKTFHFFTYLCEELVCKQANKSTHLLGIGGGNVTDLVGFLASVYMRGIDVSFVPTTLLATVDASIGGKNALNVGNVKNLLGSIHLPRYVYVNQDVIGTLADEEFLSGFAEIIKTGFLFDNSLLTKSKLLLSKKHACSSDNASFVVDNATLLKEIIICSMKHKVRIVEEDIYSAGKRNLLNFGHTIGHALELQYGLPHGWAVAFGMLFEAQIAMNMGLTPPFIFTEICQVITTHYDLNKTNYNIKLDCIDIQQLIEIIRLDKKILRQHIQFPVVLEIGKSELFTLRIEEFINSLGGIRFMYE